MKNKDIILMTPVGYTGYGVVGWNIAKALSKINIATHISPISSVKYSPNGPLPHLDTQEEIDLFAKLTWTEYNPKAPCIKIWHQFDLADRIGTGKYFAFPFFELDTFNTTEKFHLSIPDELIVCSNWAKNILIDNNIKQKINVIPLGVDTEIFDHNMNHIYKKNDDSPYIFVMIGKWEVRKAYDILLNVFNKAFNINDNVELRVVASSDPSCFSQKEMNEWHSFYSSGPMASKVKIIPRLNTHKDVANIIASSDCGIFLSRAEGWNLELLEVMAMNKPVIATNYSAHTEFCNNNNAYLIDITDKEKAFDGKWFHGEGNWAKIGDKQIDQAVDYMRYLYNNRIRTNPEGLKTGQDLSWKNSSELLMKCIE